MAFVTYSLKEDGLKAAESLHNTELRGRTISVEPAKKRSELKAERPDLVRKFGKKRREFEKRTGGPEAGGEKLNKNARLVVRNLPWAADEDTLREHFAKFGNVKETRVLRKPDGKLVGCAFVQFETVPQASKALKALNAQPFLSKSG